MGLSENRLNPIVPNGFADHYPYEKWLNFIGKINPTFSDKPIWSSLWHSFRWPHDATTGRLVYFVRQRPPFPGVPVDPASAGEPKTKTASWENDGNMGNV